MNYRPNPQEWELWDTWMFPDPDGQRMHLFYLANKPRDHWEWIGHVVSDDLIHWQELPPIHARRPGDPYDVGIIGTGMVFQAPDGEFLMSYTTNLGTPRARIAFLHSRDLVHWEKRWPEPCIEAQLPYYETDPKKAPTTHPAFRDAYVHKVGEHYEALICAQSTSAEPLHSAVVARYRSAGDDLQRWQALPPLVGPNLAVMMEVPEHFQVGDKHYVLWSNTSGTGVLCETPSRRRTQGTYYVVSDAYEGPYVCPQENLLIGSGDTNHCQSYVGRTILWKDEWLLYHHQGPPKPAFGFPKRILQRGDGSLTLRYWPGIEQAHTRSWPVPLDRVTEISNLKIGRWQPTGRQGLEGSINAGGSLVLVEAPVPADVHLRCRVTAESAARWGVTLRDKREGLAKIKGVALQADLQHGEWQFGEPVHHWCSRIDPIEVIREAPRLGQVYQLDLFIRDIYFEAYVDGVWKFTRVIAGHAREGQIGFFVDSGTVRFDEIEVWELAPMANPFSPLSDQS